MIKNGFLYVKNILRTSVDFENIGQIGIFGESFVVSEEKRLQNNYSPHEEFPIVKIGGRKNPEKRIAFPLVENYRKSLGLNGHREVFPINFAKPDEF